MRTITITWDLPTTREGGKQPLPASEIANTEVLLSADAGKTFTSLARVAANGTQTISKDIADGNYTLRFIVTDTGGKVGKPMDAVAAVVSAAPGQVMNITVTVS